MLSTSCGVSLHIIIQREIIIGIIIPIIQRENLKPRLELFGF